MECIYHSILFLSICRVEPRCSGYRFRWFTHRFPDGPQSEVHTFRPLAPASNRKSSFPRYGSPTTFPMCLSVTVVVEVPRLTELVYPQSNGYAVVDSPCAPRLIAVLPLQEYSQSIPDISIELSYPFTG